MFDFVDSVCIYMYAGLYILLVCMRYVHIHATHIHALNTYDRTILLHLLTQDTHTERFCVYEVLYPHSVVYLIYTFYLVMNPQYIHI